MANISPSTHAINSIAQCLVTASEAAHRLDNSVSKDLRSLLHIASCEAERVRKAARKVSAPKKPASKSGKNPAKRERKGVAKLASSMAPRQAKGRRKAALANGAAAAH